MTRIEAVAKAREARAAKKLARDANPQATETTQVELIEDSDGIEAAIAEASLEGLKISLWRECMVANMLNGRLLHPAQFESISKFADAYVELAMEKFE